MWSKDFKECQECGKTENPHHAKGLCKVCYLKQYREEPESEIRDTINPRGVGLHEVTEWGYVDKVAEELGESVTPHAVAVYFMRYAISEHKAGRLKLNVVKQPKLEFID